MSVKEETLSWLGDLPEESPKWSELHEELRLLRAIERAEADVQAGRVFTPEQVRQTFEEKWAKRRSMS
jgi:Spy/CpxP family protein refolding chaperone